MSAQDDSVVDAFIDLRSPYSYLSLGPARQLAERTGVRFAWWPYITDFRSAYGGEVDERTSRDVAKVKYLYMDCRRLAKKQGT
jgi:2-hydroxychromene-2-carboxylate isomerase